MSKYYVIVKRVDYIPEGNYTNSTDVFYQEISGDDVNVVKKIAVALNQEDDDK